MKSHAFRRGILVAFVYVVVVLGLVLVQFSRNTGFTFNVGSIAVTGKYERGSDEPSEKGDRVLAGPLGLFFGGMEFRLAESDGLAAVREGRPHPIKPSSISLIEGGVVVRLADKSELRFVTLFVGGEETLRATAVFARGTTELRIPYRPMRSSRIADLGNGKSAIVSGGESFSFSSASVDAEKRVAALKPSSASFSYGKITPKKGFSPAEFITSTNFDNASYDGSRFRWLDQAYSAWERAMSANPDEETVIAYTAESARRGNYRSAVATAPKAFVDGSGRSFRSSVFYGRLDDGLRSLLAAERETLGRLSRMANERNIELFIEPDLMTYVAVRASKTLADDIASFARSIDPATTSPSLAVGFIECWTDWELVRADQANPFEKVVDQARFILSGMLRKAGSGTILLVSGDKADITFSLRAGRALINSAAVSKDKAWGDIGRALILSSLSLADGSGSLPSEASFAEDAPSVVPAPSTGRIPASHILKYAVTETSLPRVVPLLFDGGSAVWAWSAVPVRASLDSGVLDVSADFPVGETHYLLIRGVRPFTKIQLYGIDFRTDPRFERYDSSGWSYSPSEQALLVKMKHKSPTEHIRVYF